MRDDDERAPVAGEERLEPLQPGEIEVVRRLVEAEDVEAAEQDRGERDAGRFAAGEARERAFEWDVEAELGERRGGAGVEVGAAAGEELLQRCAVLDGELRLVAEPGGQPVHAHGRRSDAGAPLEVGAQRLIGHRVALLRQVPDGERGRRPADAPAVRFFEPGEQAQERRLAGAVRADDPEPRPRRHDEVDVREDDLGSVRLRDAGGGERAGWADHARPPRREPSDNVSLGRTGLVRTGQSRIGGAGAPRWTLAAMIAGMEQRLSLVTLGVADVGRARRFYEALGWRPSAGAGDEVTFFQAGGMVLGLWSRASLAEDSGIADDGGGWGGITLAHNVRSPAEVDAVLAEVEAAGGTSSAPARRRSGAATRASSPTWTATAGRSPTTPAGRSPTTAPSDSPDAPRGGHGPVTSP